jgi:CHAT domain-containing protein/tetratricopeptide (TPR) repeat protein
MSMDTSNTLFLEVYRSENRLKMSITQDKELARTVSHYSLCAISFEDVSRICQEMIATLNRAQGKSQADPALVNNLKTCGQLLWEQVLTRSVKHCLKSAGEGNLVISLEEELVSIPWELLYDGKDFLGLKFSVGRLVRSQHEQLPSRYRNIPAKPKMLILANPTGDLKAAYEEGINIRNQFDKARDKIAIDFKSTEISTLYVKKSLRDYDIVHFAGHCECEKSRPQETGWLLSDGKFTAQDILSIGEDSLLPSLVFSNACQSAEENTELIQQDYQEKTYSLASAFIFSGVRHYIGSIHKIVDPVSLVMAREFYTNLIKGNTVGEAVRLARLRLIKEYGVNSCFWASYILYGDPNFVLFHSGLKPALSKIKNKVNFCQKHRKKFCLALIGLILSAGSVLTLFFLPSINPSAYYLFKKAQREFSAGKNTQVIGLAKQVIDKDPKLLEVYPLLADSYARKGKSGESLKCYFEYILQSQEKGNFKHLANAYIKIGWFYHQSGFYPRAFEFYQKALDLTRRDNDKQHEALVLRKLAVWHMDKGENDIALQLLTKSSEINREKQFLHDYKYNLACDYFDLGLLFTNKEDFSAAREFYNKSLKVFNALNLKNEISDYYFNLGEICVWEKQYQKALEYYLIGLKIDQAQENLPSISSDYSMLGELYLDMDNLSQAEEYFKKAEELARKINGRMELAAASCNLGLLYKKKNQKNLARQYLRQAQEIYRSVETPDYKIVQQELLTIDSPN